MGMEALAGVNSDGVGADAIVRRVAQGWRGLREKGFKELGRAWGWGYPSPRRACMCSRT